MKRTFSLAAAAVFISLAGFLAVGTAAADGHSAMTDQGSVACVGFCLANVHIDQVLPVLQQTGHLMLVVIYFALTSVLPSLLALVFAIYAAKPRPSPDIVALYAHYLE